MSTAHADKVDLQQVEDAESLKTSPSTTFDAARGRRVIRKVDYRLLPILGALYSIALIDRNNLGVARVAGMARSLELTVGERYSIVGLVFFPGYILFEIPAQAVLAKVGPRNLLTTIVISWGAIMTGMTFVTNWWQLAICRVLLGIFEAGLLPAAVFLITTWYTRFETQQRLAWFYVTSLLMNGFSAALGYAISTLAPRNGWAGWQHIFFVFGIVTIILGLLSFVLVVDFPEKNRFLKAEETAFVIDRINVDRGDAVADKITLGKMLRTLSDLKIWAYGLMFMATTMPNYAIAYFLPVILSAGGFSTKKSLVLTACPHVVGASFVVLMSWVSDRTRQRGACIAFNAVVDMTGLFILAYGNSVGVRYFGSFLVMCGCAGNLPAIFAYQSNNIRMHSNRAVGSAVTIMMGGVGGIFATVVYRQKDFPAYIPGFYATIGCQIMVIAITGALTIHFRRKNKAADRGECILEGLEGFRYVI